MKVFVLSFLLLLACPVLADERVRFLIPSKPAGARVKHNAEEWGRTGEEFSVAKSKLPSGGNLNLQLERDNYEPYHLVIPNMVLNGPLVEFPKSPIILEPVHPLVPLQENPLPLFAGLAAMAGVALVVRRNSQLKQGIEKRERLEERLQHQIKTRHDFAFTLIGRYRVLEQLGEGGIAKVFRAVPDATLDESEAVALKVLHPHLCREEGHTDRFIREGRVSQGLIHPNIIRLYEVDKEGDLVYLVLELLEGIVLKERMKEQAFSPETARPILEQIFSALAYAHGEGVVHRDLTPSNIMITTAGKVKVMDFGLARKQEVGHTITVTGVIQGTPGYMAPEQLTETLDARTDQYSLGVVMFEMFTGRRPIDGTDPMQLIMATYTQDAPDPREFNPKLPGAVAEFILKLLRRDPEERFATMEEARKAFETAFREARI